MKYVVFFFIYVKLFGLHAMCSMKCFKEIKFKNLLKKYDIINVLILDYYFICFVVKWQDVVIPVNDPW
jgi:hypothetical protein